MKKMKIRGAKSLAQSRAASKLGARTSNRSFMRRALVFSLLSLPLPPSLSSLLHALSREVLNLGSQLGRILTSSGEL